MLNLESYNQIGWPQYLLDRFWEKVIPPINQDKDCWIWTGCKSIRGYGTFNNTVVGKIVRAHRFSYELFYGIIPNNLIICHDCDNPPCVNPNHLKTATPKINMEDCKNRNRNVKGSALWSAKLNEEDVEDIIFGALNQIYTSAKQVTSIYNISRTELCYLFSKKAWVHITDRFSKDELIKAQYALNVNATLTPDDVNDIRNRLQNGETQKNIANYYGIQQTAISRIKLGKTWNRI